jgi:hypothetical protein
MMVYPNFMALIRGFSGCNKNAIYVRYDEAQWRRGCAAYRQVRMIVVCGNDIPLEMTVMAVAGA